MGKVDLKSFLEASPTERVTLSFRQIEMLSGEALPDSLRVANGWVDPQPDAEGIHRDLSEAGFVPADVDPTALRVVLHRSGPTHAANLEAAGVEPTSDEHGRKRRRHPAFGALKGLISVAPGYDLTQPTIESDWLEETYGG
ncbi:hypothetical protein [Chthonobacter rhizosphaerae]|uniref:hypothetical protein n=1 Tax=Chthonobacter rhizosphaerae TaxID=2735553 RepID=UPI0015EF5FC2|nr:hypothetical protein [Chthonobacter rhizosphaerae]